MRVPLVVLWSFASFAALFPLAVGTAEATFVNFESGHSRPLSLSPDGSLLFAVDTPNNSLSIFEVDSQGLTLAAQVPVGLEPVAVASRVHTGTNRTEVWVVNHLSDSVSIVEVNPDHLSGSRVKATLLVGDEPCDVVFGGSPVVKAFITTARRGQNLPASIQPRMNEGGIPRALVWAFDAQDSSAASGGIPVTVLELFGDTPRALAVSPDGSTVYAAVFHSGNRTSVIREAVVEANGGYPPPPVDSPYFGDPDVFKRSVIVKFDAGSGEWLDAIGRDWSAQVKFSLPDQDVFAIDADADPPVAAGGVDTFRGVGTTIFNMAIRPGSGSVFVSNSEARNDKRFEPLAAGGVQGRATEERITVLAGMSVMPVPVNPHVDDSVPTGPPGEAGQSLALLNDLAFSSDGTTLFAAAMGSDDVAVFDADGLEAGIVSRELVNVGRGPSGLALDEANDRIYVMNRIDHTISIVSQASSPGLRAETGVVPVGDDPTPVAIREGRRFLYGARDLSGHGDQACASCHTFGDADQLAWDLGDPYRSLEPNPNPILNVSPLAPPLEPFSPIKGPLTTQTLRGLDGAGPMHWRGDRTAASDPGGDAMDEAGNLKKFNASFVSLLGRSTPLTDEEMQAFTVFVLSIRHPPNPVLSLDNERTKDQQAGFEIFTGPHPSPFTVPCEGCHSLPLGTAGLSNTGDVNALKIPQLRALYQKVGKFGGEQFSGSGEPFAGDQVRGFGLTHDGGVTTPREFASGFDFPDLDPGVDSGRLLSEFLLSLDTGFAPAVGQQVTIAPGATDAQRKRLQLLLDRSIAGDCDLTMATRIGEETVSGVILPNGSLLLDDSESPPVAAKTLLSMSATPGGEQTYTCRPPGSGRSLTIDHDEDGVTNADEEREGTDPRDPASVPYDCAGYANVEAATMVISRTSLPAGDESFALKASFSQPAFTVDPAADGMILLLRDAGELRVVQSLPSAGWSTPDGKKWRYEGPEGAVVSKATLSRKEGVFRLGIKGKGGDFRISTATPVLELVLGGDTGAAGGHCIAREFGAGPIPPCEVTSTRLKCR